MLCFLNLKLEQFLQISSSFFILKEILDGSIPGLYDTDVLVGSPSGQNA